ncbi:hypothetical protein C8R44DRAFT_812735 [Mycena epipterygia]|nr:hypothetical protein C8R44DRAFT_812735 [Mycena epipterygia]
MSGKYIVVFKAGASEEAIKQLTETVQSDGGEVTQTYDTLMKGFAAKLDPATFAKFTSLQADADSIIDYIEPDGVVTTQ